MTEIEWVNVFLETQPKGKKNKPKRVIKGVAKIDDNIYYLEYILFSGFEWWTANLIAEFTDTINKNTVFTEPSLYYNSIENKFYSFENLPTKIKLFIKNEI